MQIFFPKEREEEKRVSILPETAKKLLEIGMHVDVESGIGQGLFLSDELYESMGIKVSKDRKASLSSSDIVCRINKPELDEVAVQKKDSLHISFLDPFINTNLIKKFADSNTFIAPSKGTVLSLSP